MGTKIDAPVEIAANEVRKNDIRFNGLAEHDTGCHPFLAPTEEEYPVITLGMKSDTKILKILRQYILPRDSGQGSRQCADSRNLYET